MSKLTLRQLGINYKATNSEKDFNALYRAISPGIKIYIKKFIKNHDEIEDVFSNVITNMYNKIDKFDPSKGNISTWIYRIAYNECMYLWRMKKKSNNMSLSSFDNDESGLEDRVFAQFSVENDFMVKEDKRENDSITLTNHNEVMLVLERLPKIEKDLLLERWMNNSKYEEIADKFSIPLHAVKNKISRGKKKFFKIYEEHKNADEINN